MSVAITPDGSRAVVTCYGTSAARGQRGAVIALPFGPVLEDAMVGDRPEQVELSADGALGLVNRSTLIGLESSRLIRRCHVGEDLARFRLRWTVTPTGSTSEVNVEATSPGQADDRAEARCLADALRDLSWPCPSGARPIRVEANVCLAQREVVVALQP